jgi:hypothetical protein
MYPSNFLPESHDNLAKSLRRGENISIFRRQSLHTFCNRPRCDISNGPKRSLKGLRQVRSAKSDNYFRRGRRAPGENCVPQSAAVCVNIVGDLSAFQLEARRQFAQVCRHRHLCVHIKENSG